MMTEAKTPFIRLGDFLFKYRNALFPVVLAVVFFTYSPPHSYWGSHRLEIIKDYGSILVIAAGLAVRAAVIGYAYIKRGGLNKKVYADTLVTQGFFQVCRNPLYVGNMLIYTGVFLMHGNPYIIFGGTLGMLVIYSSIIAAEEYFLRQKFGADFAAYCREVPRWLPRFSRIRSATQDMRFNFRRVVLKDYTTIANACFIVIALELLEQWHAAPFKPAQAPAASVAAMLGLIVVTVGISFAKRRKWLRA